MKESIKNRLGKTRLNQNEYSKLLNIMNVNK